MVAQKGLKDFFNSEVFRKYSIVMNMERELQDLAQTHLDHIQDIRWHDLRRAVVIHLEHMDEQDMLIHPRIPTREVCQHILQNNPCPNWEDGSPCGAGIYMAMLRMSGNNCNGITLVITITR